MDSVRNRRNYENEISQFSLSPAYIYIGGEKNEISQITFFPAIQKKRKEKRIPTTSRNSSSGLYIEKRRNNGKRPIVLAGEIRKKKKLSRGAIQKEKKEIQKKLSSILYIYRKSKYIRKASRPKEIQKASFSLYIEREKLP